MISDRQKGKLQQPEAARKFLRQAIALSFVVQAVLIGVRGNFDVLSGKFLLDVIPWMITQSVELILKAQRTEKSLKKSDRRFRSDQ